MKTKAFSLITAASLAFGSMAFGGAKTYQVTGPVLEVNDSMIVVQKGKDRWELDRNSDTRVNGEVKVGDKVTINYTMTAKDVEVKAGKGTKKEKPGPTGSPG
jgi:FKBP-type peptidyl-prolyl cis-trans isomerase (trigger factor)